MSNIYFTILGPIFVVFFSLYLYAWMRVLDEGGQPWWAVFVPYYNVVAALRATGYSGWLALLLFVPLANLVLWIGVHMEAARIYNKDPLTTLGISLAPPIFMPLLLIER